MRERGPHTWAVVLAILALAMAASVLGAQSCSIVTSRNYFVTRVNGDSVGPVRTTGLTLAAALINLQRANPGKAVTFTMNADGRLDPGCLTAPAAITRTDTLWRIRVDTLRSTDTLRITDTVHVATPSTGGGSPAPVTPDTQVTAPPPAPLPPPVVVTPPPPPVIVDTSTPAPVAGLRFVSAQQLANWQALKVANDPLYRLAVTNCGLTATNGEKYADTGLWCAWVAVVNGDSVAAAKAVKKLRANAKSTSGNTRREYMIENVLMRDMLARWMTPADYVVVDTMLATWASAEQAASTGDSDQMTGAGCGRVLWNLSGGAVVNPNVLPSIASYVVKARGGQWIESGHYNLGTVMLLQMCNAAYQTVTGTEVVPGVTQFLLDAGKSLALEVTPDYRQPIQWGDEEKPRDIMAYKRATLLHAMDHPWAVTTLDSLYATYGRTGYQSAEPWARALLYARSRVGQAVPNDAAHVAAGMGQLTWRHGNAVSWAMAARKTGVHHTNTMAPFGVQLYRDGEWVITQPLAYSLGLNDRIQNGPLYAGLAQFAQSGMTWADSGNGWHAIAGETKGAHYVSAYPSVPVFLRSGHRVVLFTTEAGFDVIVVRDSADLTDPRTLPNYTSYRNSGTYLHQQAIVEYDGAAWSRWHSPVAPTIAGDALSWTTAKGQSVSVQWFSDKPTQTATVDEATYLVGTIQPSEKHWQTRIRFDGVLYQVVLAGRGTPPTVTRSGDTITVGSKRFTITSAAIAAN